jgi:hypothetical protein
MRPSFTGVFLSLILVSSAFASLPPTSSLIKLESFKQVKVGDSITTLSHLANERTRWGSPRRVAQFYFYLLRSDLPSRCLNMQCGKFARKILAKNGFLIGGADLELAKDVGLEYVSDNADHQQSLLIVTDSAGIVTQLYQNVSAQNLDEVLTQISSR